MSHFRSIFLHIFTMLCPRLKSFTLFVFVNSHPMVFPKFFGAILLTIHY